MYCDYKVERMCWYMSDNVKKVGKLSVRVVRPEDNILDEISSDDQEMDKRAVAAVNSAIRKAMVCNQPIAKYDSRKKKAYVKYADGVKEYVD
jgi:hypothetical protein